MSLNVEVGTGSASSDSYVTIAECDAYHLAHGGVAWALVAGLIFAWNWHIKHEQSIGYDRAVAEYNVKLLEAKEAADKRDEESA